MSKRVTTVIEVDDDGFVALCPELDIASQGDTVEEARNNLREAVELFFECAFRIGSGTVIQQLARKAHVRIGLTTWPATSVKRK